MEPPRIALRADASTAIGTGHVKRCLALAQALREAGADVRLVSRALGVDIRAMAEAARCGFSDLRQPDGTTVPRAKDAPPHVHWAEVGWQDDAVETVQALQYWGPQWVVVDHYAFDARWHRMVGAALASRVAVIDDLADRDLAAALLIDHNQAQSHRRKYAGRIADATRLLGGPRHALLGPTYAHAARYEFQAEVRSIGIFMGGTDSGDLSSLALRACREQARFRGPIEIATTSANPHLDSLTALADGLPPTTITLDAPELSGFFARHDLQIGAGGGATWERCCIGVPTLAFAAAANQTEVVQSLAALGVLATLESDTDVTAAAIGRAAQALLSDPQHRRSLAESSRRLVDGKGARRVALSLCAERLQVRPATLDDARRMFDWRNDPATRVVSRDSAEIFWPAHMDWLRLCLADPERTLLIGSVGSIPVGVVRFDCGRDGEAEVSIYLDPALYGLGLGRALLRAGEAFARPGCRQFVAAAIAGNESSHGLFGASGYRQQDDGRWRKLATAGQAQSDTPCSE